MTNLWNFTIGVVVTVCFAISAHCQTADFWNNQAEASIQQALNIQPNTKQAKNVIFFVGDGMDITTIVASRIRQGQLNGGDGEANVLSWEAFPHAGLAKTYTTDEQTADSAGTATAFFGGYKTKNGVIGLDDNVNRGDCASAQGADLPSNLHMAHAVGKATGIVTTDRLTGATPSATYAHSADRSWESDVDIPRLQNGCTDIAYQLINDNDFINVILGGGRREFMLDSQEDPEYYDMYGRREDGNDLITQWIKGKPASAQYVWNDADFQAVDSTKTDYLLGLFQPSLMRYSSDRANDGAGEPTLAEMTQKAIEILQKDSDGFFLVVESALIDKSHHNGRANDALGETIELADAVTMATQMTSSDDTLIVVTADHAHTIGFVGYPTKNNPILSVVDDQNSLDRVPYTTLNYLNGPGGEAVEASWKNGNTRRDYTGMNTEDRTWIQDAIVPLSSETHGGTDVSVYALGPNSHLFSGVCEQNYIAHVVRYSACLDAAYSSVCDTPVSGVQEDQGASKYDYIGTFGIAPSIGRRRLHLPKKLYHLS